MTVPDVFFEALRILPKATKWIVRKLYPESALKAKIQISIRATGEPCSMQLDDQSSIQVWGTIHNHGPFDQRMQHMSGKLWVGGIRIPLLVDFLTDVAAHSSRDFQMWNNLTSDQRNKLANLSDAEKEQARIEFDVNFDNFLYRFAIFCSQERVNMKIANEHIYRTKQAA